MHDTPEDAAELIRQIYDFSEQRKNETETEGAVEVLRNVSETHGHDDSVDSSSRSAAQVADPSIPFGYGSW